MLGQTYASMLTRLSHLMYSILNKNVRCVRMTGGGWHVTAHFLNFNIANNKQNLIVAANIVIMIKIQLIVQL